MMMTDAQEHEEKEHDLPVLQQEVRQWSFVNRDENSSIYSTVADLLLETGAWSLSPPKTARFNLMLGDRNKLPYSRLGLVYGLTQIVNYYRGNNCLCRKAAMEKTLREYAQVQRSQQHSLSSFGDAVDGTEVEATQHADIDDERKHTHDSLRTSMPEWIPETFIIRPSGDDERAILKIRAAECEGSVWIAKMSSGAKGEDIMISENVDELIAFAEAQELVFCIQRYIANPLLLPGQRKFDIRCWVLLDSDYCVHIYEEGVLRTCSDAYSPGDFKDTTSHLSNHCIQEANSANFGKFEDGNEMFFDDFSRILAAKDKSLEKDILPQIHAIVKHTFAAAEHKLRVDTGYVKYFPFQLFGFDFLVDSSYKVWLLEINAAPAAAERLREDIAKAIIVKAILPHCPFLPATSERPPVPLPQPNETRFVQL